MLAGVSTSVFVYNYFCGELVTEMKAMC